MLSIRPAVMVTLLHCLGLDLSFIFTQAGPILLPMQLDWYIPQPQPPPQQRL
jgi:hypothetical protein